MSEWQDISTAPKDGTEILVQGFDSTISHRCVWNPDMDSWNADYSDFVVTGCWETLCCNAWFEPSEAEFWKPVTEPEDCCYPQPPKDST